MSEHEGKVDVHQRVHPSLATLASAIGDLQRWAARHKYETPAAVDFRNGAAPAAEGVIVNVNLGGLIEAITDLNRKADSIMSAVSDFAAQVNDSFTKIGASVDGIVGDVQALNDKITALQNSPGTLTPEDQASLDDIQAKAAALSDKLAALDAQTAPAAVPAPVPAA